MKNVDLNTILNVLNGNEVTDKARISALEAVMKEVNRAADEKAARADAYAEAWEVVREVLASTDAALSVAEIFARCENLPEGFKKGSVQYGLLNKWNDEIVKIEGKPNTYRLKR